MTVRWSWACIRIQGEADLSVSDHGGYFNTQQEAQEDLQAHLETGTEGSTEAQAALRVREAGWENDVLLMTFPGVAAWIAYAVPEGQSSEQAAVFLLKDRRETIHEKLTTTRESWVTTGSGCVVVAAALSGAGILAAAWISSVCGA